MNLETLHITGNKLEDHLIKKLITPFEIAKRICGRRTPLLLTGGAVRNLLLDIPTNHTDFDFLGDIDIEKIERKHKNLLIGRWNEVSTIKLRIGGGIYDFTSTTNPQLTLLNNDITISNLCVNESGDVNDWVGGLESLAKREIKINDAEAKILRDPSRILRVFRMAVQLGFTIEENTFRSAVLNANLLENTILEHDLWKILSLDYGTRLLILRNLYLYDIDRHLPLDIQDKRDVARLISVEEDVMREAPIEKIVRLFNTNTYLVGGAIRDIIWGKKVKDFDFKVKMPVFHMIEILEQHGYTRTSNLDLIEGEYYFNETANAISIFIDGKDIDLTEMKTTNISVLISQGDVNFSCCVFNANTRKVENPEIIQEIDKKELLFCNPEFVASNPLIVINALKQISRLPDIVISDLTKGIITRCMSKVCDYIRKHPEMKYKIASLFGNLNSEAIIGYFTGNEDILEGFSIKMAKLLVSNPKFISESLDSVTPDDRTKLVQLIKIAYGESCDETKIFPPNVNSVVYYKENDQIVSCCLIDGERIYAIAAVDGEKLIEIMRDVVGSNYNTWGTVNFKDSKIIAICEIAGLKIELNPEVVLTILRTKYAKYTTGVDIIIENGIPVFSKNSEPGYNQVLVRS
jgi:hypothetical protein